MQNAISPLDGRNENDVIDLQQYFSEEGLIFFRVLVEISWINYLSAQKDLPLRKLTAKEQKILQDIIENFDGKSTERIKEIEKTTNHDVKAVEIFLREKFKKTSLKDIVEWIHFACTSEDINNLAWALILREAIKNVMLPELDIIYKSLLKRVIEWKTVPMLARTHGQPASPTTLGKEILVFTKRLERQMEQIEFQDFMGKFSGATGNFSAHSSAFPKANWLKLSKKFVESFELTWNPVTPQIEPHDFVAEISHKFCRINTILTDFARDMWTMISFNFFTQKTKKGEVGSSVMPHKVNPINFENAEGNMGIANALFKHFAEKLPISRLQRDLSDSTVFRNIGVAFGHTLVAFKKLQKGIEKLTINKKTLLKDLQNHPEVLAEAVQTVMRAEGIDDAYNKLKEFTRGKKIDLEKLHEFINGQAISKERKNWLLNLKTETFTGLAEEIVNKFGI